MPATWNRVFESFYTHETSFRFDFIYILEKWDHFESWFCINSPIEHSFMQVFQYEMDIKRDRGKKLNDV